MLEDGTGIGVYGEFSFKVNGDKPECRPFSTYYEFAQEPEELSPESRNHFESCVACAEKYGAIRFVTEAGYMALSEVLEDVSTSFRRPAYYTTASCAMEASYLMICDLSQLVETRQSCLTLEELLLLFSIDGFLQLSVLRNPPMAAQVTKEIPTSSYSVANHDKKSCKAEEVNWQRVLGWAGRLTACPHCEQSFVYLKEVTTSAINSLAFTQAHCVQRYKLALNLQIGIGSYSISVAP